MTGRDGARIWYQSSTDPDADRPYFTRLESFLRSVSSPACEVEAFGMQPGGRYLHPITEFRCAAQVIANALTAEQQGYDAFVIGRFQDPGLAEARSVVRIALPPGEAVAGVPQRLHSGYIWPGARRAAPRTVTRRQA